MPRGSCRTGRIRDSIHDNGGRRRINAPPTYPKGRVLWERREKSLPPGNAATGYRIPVNNLKAKHADTPNGWGALPSLNKGRLRVKVPLG